MSYYSLPSVEFDLFFTTFQQISQISTNISTSYYNIAWLDQVFCWLGLTYSKFKVYADRNIVNNDQLLFTDGLTRDIIVNVNSWLKTQGKVRGMTYE